MVEKLETGIEIPSELSLISKWFFSVFQLLCLSNQSFDKRLKKYTSTSRLYSPNCNSRKDKSSFLQLLFKNILAETSNQLLWLRLRWERGKELSRSWQVPEELHDSRKRCISSNKQTYGYREKEGRGTELTNKTTDSYNTGIVLIMICKYSSSVCLCSHIQECSIKNALSAVTELYMIMQTYKGLMANELTSVWWEVCANGYWALSRDPSGSIYLIITWIRSKFCAY